jgi:hypothetical protein
MNKNNEIERKLKPEEAYDNSAVRNRLESLAGQPSPGRNENELLKG